VPFQISGPGGPSRCAVCGKLVAKPAVALKTCCVNKAAALYGEERRRAWEASWLKRREQVKSAYAKLLERSKQSLL